VIIRCELGVAKCHMTLITLLMCHSAITSGGVWLGTVLASTAIDCIDSVGRSLIRSLYNLWYRGVLIKQGMRK